ncbi:hypothetical protein MtrunA17_Chr2g0297551 [Medicago truncatula]|uniref:Uncharacterized protein n=1 Tax=Medicago truncatula TaxID=3880 RepID=A0A396JA65_MEDTR|nr:hypothetical protein MtrunA17_Chr2g0297551 [Medicago truncatula]
MSSRNNHNNLGHSQKLSDKKDSRDPAKNSPILNQKDLAYNNGSSLPVAAKSSKKNPTLSVKDMSYSNT